MRLNGNSLATLRSAPQVAAAEHQSVYAPVDSNDPTRRINSGGVVLRAYPPVPRAELTGHA